MAALLLLTCAPAFSQALSPGREFEPVVLNADWFPLFVEDHDIARINLYRYEGSTFQPIPFQIDKRRKINLRWNRITDGGLLGGIENCEYGYFAEKAAPPDRPNPFLSNYLQRKDEVVFLLKDAGSERAPETAWVSVGSTLDVRYEIILHDKQTSARRYVYAYVWNAAPPDKDTTTDYVTWTQDSPPPGNPCSSDNPQACGTAESGPTSAGGVPTLLLHFEGNWITDGLSIKEGTAYADLWNRIEYRMNMQTEDNWSNEGNGRRWLGVIDGPIRIVRCVQGARSGEHTTKCEFVYPTQLVSRLNLRVHPLDNDVLNIRINHEPGVAQDSNQNSAKETYLWKESRTIGDEKFYDLIDGTCAGQVPCRAIPPTAFDDWTEVASEVRGTYVMLKREPRPVPHSTRSYTYSDDDTSGMIGEFGREWLDVGNTQDGFDNSGACNSGEDPEGMAPPLHYSRLEFVVFPRPLRQDAAIEPGEPTPQQTKRNDSLPVLPFANEQWRNVPETPVAPCRPGLSAANPGTGVGDLTVDPTGCVGTAFRIYRAEGTVAPLAFLADIKASTSFVDRSVRFGKTYRYAVTAYNEHNVEGPNSTEVTLAVTDTTPPGVPTEIAATPGNQSATTVWDPKWETDIKGFNVYMATSAGGPYGKMNGQPINASIMPQWVQGGLVNGQTYYFKLTATDLAGNESPQSSSVSVVPSP